MAAIGPPNNGDRCRNHPWLHFSGVCPACLRDRLSTLCPDCAKLRPCQCDPLPSISDQESAQSLHPSSSAAAAKADSAVRSSSVRRNEGRKGWRRRWKFLNLQLPNPFRVLRRKKPARVP